TARVSAPAAALPPLAFRVARSPASSPTGRSSALPPLGVPDTVRLIVPPLPTTVVEMVLEPLAPCTRLTLLGLAEIVKFGLGTVTVSCTVVVWVTDRSEERRVGMEGPAAALPAFTISIALLPAVTDVGVAGALTPLGAPALPRLIVPPLPTTVVAMVLEPLAPCTRLTLLGLAEIVKFGLGTVTVSCTVVVWVTDPSVPVTVSV